MANWVRSPLVGTGVLFARGLRVSSVAYEIIVSEENGVTSVLGHCGPPPGVALRPDLIDAVLRLETGERLSLFTTNPASTGRLDFEITDPESVAICWRKTST
jgi:hypothetical protein